MRIRMRYIFLIAILIVGIGVVRNMSTTTYKYNEPNVPIQPLGYTAGTGTSLSIIKAATSLRVGETGFIKLQGMPGRKYTIRSSYVRKGRIYNVIQRQTADSAGQVTFVWVVGRDTDPGVYPITISGEGETLNLRHTVLR